MLRTSIQRLLLPYLLVMAGYPAYSQTDSSSQQQHECNYSLTGKVIDLDTKEPLLFATIYVKETAKGAVSDEFGFFRINLLCKGEYTLICRHVGCLPVEMKVSVTGNTSKDFYLPHRAHNLHEVHVVRKRKERKPVQTKSELTGKELQLTQGQSIGEALKKITGVNSIQTGPSISKPVIHGLHSNRVLILNNGIRQEGQQWGSEHAPEIDPYIASRLTVVKGANSVRYGSDAIAGVILVEPKPLRDSAGIGGELNLAGFSNNRQGVASAIVEGNFAKLKPLSWRLQGTAKRAGNAKTPGYYLKNTGFEELNFSSAVGYNKSTYGAEVFYSRFHTEIGIFSGAHIGNLTDLQRAFERSEPTETSGFSYTIERPFQQVTHNLFKAKVYALTGNAGKLNFIFARQNNIRNEYDKHRPRNDSLSALNNPELRYEITTYTGDVVWEHKQVKSFSGIIGISGITQGNIYGGRYFIPNFRNYGGSIFLIERWQKEKLELEAGARYDYKWLQIFKWENNRVISPVYKFSNFSGNFGALYKFTSNFNISLNTGLAWRPPAVNELYSNGLHHGAAAVEIGDPGLQPERAYNTVLSAGYQSTKWLNAEVEVYYNYINNFIYLAPQLPPTLTIRGAFPTFYYKQVDATLKGADAKITITFTRGLSLTSKLALVRGFNNSANDHLILMPADRFENNLKYDFKDSKKLSESFVSVSVLNVLKQIRVPGNSDFAVPPAAYMLLNAEAGTSIKISGQKLDISVGFYNLLDTKYRDYLNRFRYYADEMGRNIALRIRIPFELTSGNKNQPSNN